MLTMMKLEIGREDKGNLHSILQSFWSIVFIIRIDISVQPGTHSHLSQVKHVRVKCLALFIIRIDISVQPGTHSHLSQVKHVRVKCLALFIIRITSLSNQVLIHT